MRMRHVFCLLVALLPSAPAHAEVATRSFAAQDTLRVAPDDSPDAQAMLDDLSWPVEKFDVMCVQDATRVCDAFVFFASPKPRGQAEVDRVSMEWHAARDAQGHAVDAPAILLIHEIQSSLVIARAIGRALSQRGVHAFVMHLPDYGLRRSAQRYDPHVMVPRMRQAICDARRARDAIAALPHVLPGRISIQGTSLGGFVVSPTAALDNAFESVWITLAGGQIDRVLLEGQREAAGVRASLESGGYDAQAIGRMVYQIEPLRTAHRINPSITWLHVAVADQVIPAACSNALAAAIGLDRQRHVLLPGNHHTAFVNLPRLIDDIARQLNGK